MQKQLIKLLAVLILFLVIPVQARGIPAAGKKDPGNDSAVVKKNFVVSTDMGIDDCLALLYLFRHPAVEVKAVTVCGNGMAFCGPGVRNLQGLMALGWPWNIPVSCGEESSLKYNHVFPSAWRQQCNTLMGLTLPSNPFTPSTLSAVDLLIGTIKQSPSRVVVLALGPLTDLAKALKKEPSLKSNIEMIYIMGGAVKVSGNIEELPSANAGQSSAEYNIYIDPVAADIVFRSGAPITLIPLDACNEVPVGLNFYKQLTQRHRTPQAEFAMKLFSKSLDMIGAGHYFFWDPLATIIATNPSLAEITKLRISVITNKGEQCGSTIESPSGSEIQVCLKANDKAVKELFLDILNGD